MLTPRQAQLLAFIKSEIARRDVAPTIAEMEAHLGVRSKSTILEKLNALERCGAIVRERGKSRAIQVIDKPSLGVMVKRGELRRVIAALDEAAQRGQVSAAHALSALNRAKVRDRRRA
ncbi:MAG: hypothetical protein AAFX92_03855 [Pseudomonadota bacterium]